MLPDIQNFSDLTDIDTSELLEVQIELKKHGNIKHLFSINNELLTGLSFVKRYPLDTQFIFRCELVDFVENAGAIEITSITVNDKQVLPLYQHLGSPATAFIGSNVPWVFKIDQPFYRWYHHISGQGWIA